MASSDYLCCLVCDDKIVYADTQPGTFDEPPIEAVCRSCANDMVGVVRECQMILTKHLPGDGPNAKDTISALLGVLDGPPAKRAFPMLFARASVTEQEK